MGRMAMNRNDRTGSRGGFSLIEVALALMVAASGLLAAFALFPVSLRQSMESRDTVIESAFASSVLETIGANVRQIADVSKWNDVDEWWRIAVGDGFDDFPGKHAKPSDLKNGFENGTGTAEFSLATCQVAEGWEAGGDREVRYYGRERHDVPGVASSSSGKLGEPAQWLLRLSVVRRRARSGGKSLDSGNAVSWLPNRYVVTVVSSSGPAPEFYIRNDSFTQEYFFVNRP